MSGLWRPPESTETDSVRVRDVHDDIISCGAFWERSLQWCVIPIERLHTLDITTQIDVVNSPRETSIPPNTHSPPLPVDVSTFAAKRTPERSLQNATMPWRCQADQREVCHPRPRPT